MKKIKNRVKRALAGFLREELLEYIGYRHNHSALPIGPSMTIKQLPFETICMEQEIDISGLTSGFHMREIQDGYEDILHRTKQRFANEIMDHIHVETRNLTNEQFYGRRSIVLSLRVQAKQ